MSNNLTSNMSSNKASKAPSQLQIAYSYGLQLGYTPEDTREFISTILQIKKQKAQGRKARKNRSDKVFDSYLLIITIDEVVGFWGRELEKQ